MIELLDHVLVGNLDASCLRYVMLIADFIKMVDWMEVEDFRAFASLVYPFLTVLIIFCFLVFCNKIY